LRRGRWRKHVYTCYRPNVDVPSARVVAPGARRRDFPRRRRRPPPLAGASGPVARRAAAVARAPLLRGRDRNNPRRPARHQAQVRLRRLQGRPRDARRHPLEPLVPGRGQRAPLGTHTPPLRSSAEEVFAQQPGRYTARPRPRPRRRRALPLSRAPSALNLRAAATNASPSPSARATAYANLERTRCDTAVARCAWARPAPRPGGARMWGGNCQDAATAARNEGGARRRRARTTAGKYEVT